jgi:hypothetical protein
MTTINSTGFGTFRNGAELLAMGEPVCLVSGVLSRAALSPARPVIGVTAEAIAATAYGAVRTFGGGSYMIRVGEAVAAGEYVPLSGTSMHLQLIALESATAEGDIIECLPALVCGF